jgi:hypothetical protein
MWNEEVVAQFKVLVRHLRGETEVNNEVPQSGQSMFRPRFKPGGSRLQVRIVAARAGLL